MTNAITFFNNGDIGNNGSANTVNMGISNIFLADSMRISLSRVGSGNNTVRFNPAFNGSNAITIIRNLDGVSRNVALALVVIRARTIRATIRKATSISETARRTCWWTRCGSADSGPIRKPVVVQRAGSSSCRTD